MMAALSHATAFRFSRLRGLLLKGPPLCGRCCWGLRESAWLSLTDMPVYLVSVSPRPSALHTIENASPNLRHPIKAVRLSNISLFLCLWPPDNFKDDDVQRLLVILRTDTQSWRNFLQLWIKKKKLKIYTKHNCSLYLNDWLNNYIAIFQLLRVLL